MVEKYNLKIIAFPPGWLPGECSRLKPPPQFPFWNLNASSDNENYNDDNNNNNNNNNNNKGGGMV